RRGRQSRNAVLKDPAVVFADAEFFAGTIRRLKVLAYPERAVGVDAPGEFDPELVFLPDFAQSGLTMRFVGKVELPATIFQSHAQHRLAETDPACGVRLLAHEIVALGSMAHRQDVIGEPGRLAPGRRKTGMTFNCALVAESFNPAH